MLTTSCPVTITSPAPYEGFLALGFKPSQKCGAKVEIHDVPPAGAVAQCRCPLGHDFFYLIPKGETH
jgi:hypothetical protein